MAKAMIAALCACAFVGSATAGESMKLQINGSDYIVQTEDNETVADIVAHLPLSLELVRYAGHEYYATLPFTPRESATQTSKLGAGYIYYWGGGNAFVVNFVDYDIAPYHSVPIGRITDMSAVDVLRHSENNVPVMVVK